MRNLKGYGPSVIVMGTAAVVLFAGPQVVQRLTYEQTRTQIIQAKLSLESNDVLQRINQANRDIALLVEPSVVHISAQYVERDGAGPETRGLSTGSGWVYDEDGHIVTNHHVIKDAVRIDVQLNNGGVREATVVGADPTTDVAVLKIKPGLLHPAQLAPLDETVNQGDLVFAFGSPFDFRFSMSSGVVSGKDRSVGVLRDVGAGRVGYENFIQVDAAVNPGNSGGPLTDYRGRVIGMNTAIATGSRRHSLEEGQFGGIGLAIPLEMIVPAVTQLIKNGYVEKGYLGVNIARDPQENARLLAQVGFSGNGVIITGVRDHEAADAAGVRKDDVVTQINGRPVRSVAQLQSMISSILPGENARLTIWRQEQDAAEGQVVDVTVPLAKLDMLRATGRLRPNQPRDSLIDFGIVRMATNTPKLARAFDATYTPGVMIEEVVPDSRLALSVEAGTTIVKVNDIPVSDVDQFFIVLGTIDFSRQMVIAEMMAADGRRKIVRLQVE